MSKEEDYKQLAEEIRCCTKCKLWNGRTKSVVGRGNKNSKIVLIGEAPGDNEDRSGLAFVGKAGRKIDTLLKKAKIAEDKVLFTNIIRCRPPKNIFPDDSNIPNICLPYLKRQLDIVKPRIVVLAGKVATRWFLLEGKSMGTMRTVIGPVYRHTAYPYIQQIHVTYHPAFLLRANDEALDRKVLNDLKRVAQSAARSGDLPYDVTLGPRPKQQQMFS